MAASPVGMDAREPDLERLLLDPAALEAATLRWLRPRARNRPDLRLIEWRGQRAVVKDWRGASLLLRPHARRCLAREWRALAALAGMPGVPRARLRLPDVIVVSYLDGEPLAHRRLERDAREAFFAALLARVEQMHARGVVHLDLRQRRNIVCGADGQPGLLDFEAALVLDATHVWGRLALSWGRKVDRLAILKHKARYAPRLLEPQERRRARALRVWRFAWPSAVLHRLRVALRRLRRSARS